MKKIRVNLPGKEYDIIVCANKLENIGRFIRPLDIGTDAVIITNPLIKRLFGNKIKTSLIEGGFKIRFETVPDGEKAKSEKYCLKLLNNIAEFDRSSRRVFIVALGGGVVGDLAGFVASIYKRGIPYVHVPTTLLAQVDSSIGGKTAIDLKSGKNLAGSFYQPRLVFSDVSLLKTLNKNDLVSGMAEIIKYGIIKSPGLFSFLEKNYEKVFKGDERIFTRVVSICGRIKADVVEKDEYDTKNTRVILNLGHTIGHAIESAGRYGSAYSHGHAVALGMLAASYMSVRLKLINEKTYLRIKELIKNTGLPYTLKGLCVKDILAAQEHDKKFIHGKNRFVLPAAIGKTVVKENIPISLVESSIKSLYESEKK
jgi:3-dehydroquinate synthase